MIEYLHPGVYLTEVPFEAKPIDGVPTSTASLQDASAAAHAAQVTAAPDWTQGNQSDPGVTFVELFGWLNESLLFRTQPEGTRDAGHAWASWGVAQGLAVNSSGEPAPGLSVSPGVATGASGQPLTADSPTAAHRVHKP